MTEKFEHHPSCDNTRDGFEGEEHYHHGNPCLNKHGQALPTPGFPEKKRFRVFWTKTIHGSDLAWGENGKDAGDVIKYLYKDDVDTHLNVYDVKEVP